MHQTKFSFLVEKLPDEKYASQNAVFCSYKDLSTLKQSAGAGDKFFIKINKKVVELKPAEGVHDNHIAMSKIQRTMFMVAPDEPVTFDYVCDRVPSKQNLTKIKFGVSCKDRIEPKMEFEDTELIEIIKQKFVGTPINESQNLFLYFRGRSFFILADKPEIDPLGPLNEAGELKHYVDFGFLANDTNIELFANTASIKIKSTVMKTKSVTKLDFNFDQMGIGGLDKEISDIFKNNVCY